MVTIWATVEALPKKMGLISTLWDARCKIRMPSKMMTSLAITITVIQMGMNPRTAKTMKEVVSINLSAIGSRYAPMVVF